MNSILNKLYAILRRDLLTAVRHRTGFAIGALALVLELTAFYFLSHAIGPGFRPSGVEYFPFLLVGTGVYTFFVMTMQSFLSTVQEAQQTGTMEVLMTTPTPPGQLVILSSVSAFAGNTIKLLVYILAGAAIFSATIHPNILACVCVLMLCIAIAMAIGIMAASIQITFQKGSALLWLLTSGVWSLSGAMFPVESLPQPLIAVAHALPLSYAVEGMRSAVLRGETPVAMLPTLSALLGFSAVMLPLALWAMSVSLRRARRNGTLSFY
jgi:ABC-2 type transport system permease protein